MGNPQFKRLVSRHDHMYALDTSGVIWGCRGWKGDKWGRIESPNDWAVIDISLHKVPHDFPEMLLLALTIDGQIYELTYYPQKWTRIEIEFAEPVSEQR